MTPFFPSTVLVLSGLILACFAANNQQTVVETAVNNVVESAIQQPSSPFRPLERIAVSAPGIPYVFSFPVSCGLNIVITLTKLRVLRQAPNEIDVRNNIVRASGFLLGFREMPADNGRRINYNHGMDFQPDIRSFGERCPPRISSPSNPLTDGIFGKSLSPTVKQNFVG